jgi:hypothetical protein
MRPAQPLRILRGLLVAGVRHRNKPKIVAGCMDEA